jgi:mercuric ion transport protein
VITKAALGSVGAAVAASACCIGPVVFSLMGAGALSVASTRLEPYRPWFIVATVAMLGGAFYAAYRPVQVEACYEGACTPASRRTTRIVVWIAAIAAGILVAFPYYIGYLM